MALGGWDRGKEKVIGGETGKEGEGGELAAHWGPAGRQSPGRTREERARGPAAKVGLRGVVGEGASSLSAAWEGPVLTGQQQRPRRWKGSQCFWSLSIGSEGLAGTGPPGPHRPSVTIFWSAR